MTISQPTLDALHEATLALAKVIDDARQISQFVVGQSITGEQAKTLPTHSIFKDKDGDTFRVVAPGEFVWNSSGSESGLDPVEFEPHIIQYLPEPAVVAPEPAKPAFNVGDTVRIVAGFYGGRRAGVVDRVGKIERIDLDCDGTGRVCYLVDGSTAGEVELVAAVGATASPRLSLLANYNDREIKLAPSGSDLRISLTETRTSKEVFAFLSRDKAREIAASLLAYADGERS